MSGSDLRVAAESVSYARGGRAILDRVSLTVEGGSSVAVVGPSGSGKSTLLALLAGLDRPDSGSVEVPAGAGRPGLILQGYGLAGLLTAAENVEILLQARSASAGPQLSRREIRERAAAALAEVGLSAVAGHLVEELSGGQQQRLAVARALVGRPRVLFADELTAELDQEWKYRIMDLVLGISVGGGVVVVATHDPDIAARCAASLRLVDGRVVDGDGPFAATQRTG